MITAEVIGVDKVLSWYQTMPDQARGVMAKRVAILAVMLRDYVKAEKLTGEVLHVRTGRLRRSITSQTRTSGSSFAGIVGTNVEYAAGHEFGCNKVVVVTVREYLRRTSASMHAAKMIGWRGNSRKVAARSQMLGAALVHSFTRHQHINLPERSFLRSSLNDKGGEIRQDLTAAMTAALKGMK